MGKYSDLAKDIRGDLKNFDEQANELRARREQLRLRGEKVFARHRENQGDLEAGLTELENVLADMEGSNSKGNSEEGSGGLPETSFPPKT